MADRYNVGATEFSTMEEGFQAWADNVGIGKRVVGTPASLTVLAYRAFYVLNLSPLYPWVYETAQKDSYASVENLCDLRWESKFLNKEALIQMYNWYLENYKQGTDEIGKDRRVAWDQDALAAAKYVLKYFKYGI